MTPVFIAPCGWSALSREQQLAIGRLATPGAVWVAPYEDAEPLGLRHEPIRQQRPLELWAGWLDELSEPTLVAVHPTAEPIAISRRHPVALIDADADTASEATVALALRSTWIAVRTEHPVSSAVSQDRVVALNDHDGALSLPEVTPLATRTTYHRLLTAELFNRDAIARDELRELEGVSAYRRLRIENRLTEEAPSAIDLAAECGRRGDHRGAALASYAEGIPAPAELVDAPGLIAELVELQSVERVSDIFSHRFASDPTAPDWARHIVLAALLQRLPADLADRAIAARTLSLVDELDDLSGLSPDQVEAIGRLAGAESALRTVATVGKPFSAMAANHQFRQRTFDSGGFVDPASVRKDIAKVDDQAWHVGLWHAGLAYWERLTGSDWKLTDGDPPAPAPSAAPRGLDADEISEAERVAKQALADGDTSDAIFRFDQVRAECIARGPGARTIELASRLNLAAAMKAAGHKVDAWAPLVLSAIADVRPPADLVRLRNLQQDLSRAIDEEGDTARRRAHSLESEVARGERTSAAVVAEIDTLVSHTGLWRSASSYWERAAGSAWSGQHFAPPPPKGWLPGSVNAQQSLARMLLRLRLWVGWALSQGGAPPERWQPLIGSVLSEVGPPGPLAATRARLLASAPKRSER